MRAIGGAWALARKDLLVELRAREALATRAGKDAVDADWARARRLGVTGVPTYVVGRQGVVGAQPLPVLEELVKRAGAKRRAA